MIWKVGHEIFNMQNDFSVCSACKSKTDCEQQVWTISVGSEEVKNNPSSCLIQESNPERDIGFTAQCIIQPATNSCQVRDCLNITDKAHIQVILCRLIKCTVGTVIPVPSLSWVHQRSWTERGNEWSFHPVLRSGGWRVCLVLIMAVFQDSTASFHPETLYLEANWITLELL